MEAAVLRVSHHLLISNTASFTGVVFYYEMEDGMGEWKEIGSLLPKDLVVGSENRFWRVPEWAFLPDQWTWAFLRGLRLAELSGRVWEIGVGTGMASFFLRTWFPQIELYFSDLDARCTELAVDNLRGGRMLGSGLQALHGSWDLMSHERRKAPLVDVVVGCIPQALLPRGERLNDRDNEAHYYDPKMYPESGLHHLGLGLNEALLFRAREQAVLRTGGSAILNLGGRPCLGRLLRMFRDNGYRPRVLYQEVIKQHCGTCLQPFADLEAQGEHFEFFGDREAKGSISSSEAERRRVAGDPVFHKIYVIEGTA